MTRNEIKKLDKAWGALVRKTGKCEHCNKPANQPHHIFTRTKRNTRWYIPNGVELCFHHHRQAHDNPVEFFYWLEGHIGRDFIDFLRAFSNKVWEKKTYAEVEEVLQWQAEHRQTDV